MTFPFTPEQHFIVEAVLWLLLCAFSLGVLFLVSIFVVEVVEEWSYDKKQSGNTDAKSDPVPDTVGANVVRTRPRRVSLSPWIK
jgi:hypothetical protein